MPAGRPTKYPKTQKKRDELYQALLDHGAKGLSFECFGGSPAVKEILGSYVCKDTLYEWLKKDPKFSDAKRVFNSVVQQFWEKRGASLTETLEQDPKRKTYSRGSTGAWVFNMINRCGWRSNPDTEEKDNSEVAVSISFSKKTEADDETD